MMDDDDDLILSPLDAGAAGLPPSRGEGCLARFDPDELTDEMGADFGSLFQLEE
ncbi:hypothetical protein GCM10007421_00800 [Halopseudomonas oceani]|jgi:hypothetical protein|uniref:hypothetical protein n=2 Tax=Halopseudomonas oceani TaxID=1708783 RepID=UPI00166D189E|nr:hypothetical protein [Halopseudomonas oceani]GGE30937.1 hypothetical protein GCM10007421_00800 [Halopseudomonas oceani]